jgi:hypothetical protein
MHEGLQDLASSFLFSEGLLDQRFEAEEARASLMQTQNASRRSAVTQRLLPDSPFEPPV